MFTFDWLTRAVTTYELNPVARTKKFVAPSSVADQRRHAAIDAFTRGLLFVTKPDRSSDIIFSVTRPQC